MSIGFPTLLRRAALAACPFFDRPSEASVAYLCLWQSLRMVGRLAMEFLGCDYCNLTKLVTMGNLGNPEKKKKNLHIALALTALSCGSFPKSCKSGGEAVVSFWLSLP